LNIEKDEYLRLKCAFDSDFGIMIKWINDYKPFFDVKTYTAFRINSRDLNISFDPDQAEFIAAEMKIRGVELFGDGELNIDSLLEIWTIYTEAMVCKDQ
jgi:hypothetical protein